MADFVRAMRSPVAASGSCHRFEPYAARPASEPPTAFPFCGADTVAPPTTATVPSPITTVLSPFSDLQPEEMKRLCFICNFNVPTVTSPGEAPLLPRAICLHHGLQLLQVQTQLQVDQKKQQQLEVPQVQPSTSSAERLKESYESSDSSDDEVELVFDPSKPLKRDQSLRGVYTRKSGKVHFWFFIFKALVDPAERNMIAWTGRGREFQIRDARQLLDKWTSAGNRRAKGQARLDMLWNLLRNSFCKAPGGMLITVDRVACRYAFRTEPSWHVNWTRVELDAFIREHAMVPLPAVRAFDPTGVTTVRAKHLATTTTVSKPVKYPPATVCRVAPQRSLAHPWYHLVRKEDYPAIQPLNDARQFLKPKPRASPGEVIVQSCRGCAWYRAAPVLGLTPQQATVIPDCDSDN